MQGGRQRFRRTDLGFAASQGGAPIYAGYGSIGRPARIAVASANTFFGGDPRRTNGHHPQAHRLTCSTAPNPELDCGWCPPTAPRRQRDIPPNFPRGATESSQYPGALQLARLPAGGGSSGHGRAGHSHVCLNWAAPTMRPQPQNSGHHAQPGGEDGLFVL